VGEEDHHQQQYHHQYQHHHNHNHHQSMQMKQVSLQLSCQIREKETGGGRKERGEGGEEGRRGEAHEGVRGRNDGLMGVVMLLYAHMFGITTSRNLVLASSWAGSE